MTSTKTKTYKDINFFRSEISAGVCIFFAVFFSLLVNNSSASTYYLKFFESVVFSFAKQKFTITDFINNVFMFGAECEVSVFVCVVVPAIVLNRVLFLRWVVVLFHFLPVQVVMLLQKLHPLFTVVEVHFLQDQNVSLEVNGVCLELFFLHFL